MPGSLTSGAPRDNAFWLVSVLVKLTLLRREYITSPRGTATLGRVTAKFKWDENNLRFYAKLIDNVPGAGCTGADVITGIDPQTMSVDVAAARIDGEIMAFLHRLNTASVAS